ncbi:MAG: OmpH family outer membrane protein [Saprospiraceae bacterium]|jgi:outer membrane protein|nr:OmpH family outer membrane protein [Saprospiraceae bacterium]MBK6478136.1 OmpH family outer membrane protein [Saprospiraceae bacterium]MBK6817714.1 OmpH family outer membrane protein [Saprospiraceae bacterium]MBK7373084.1 OmpH family outer membrane protein [Saprospiraceae bacterium]MBK7439849.1 OmpH family outer membrane protein [Saprospiraceae bacterium]
MKRIIFIVFLAFAWTFASAQKIAIIDITQVLENLSEYKKAQDQLDKITATWKQEISESRDKIKVMYNKYQAEQVLLSDDQRKNKEEEIMAKEKEAMEMQKAKFGPEGALFMKRQELVQPIQDKVYKAIQEYATAKGYDLILDKGSSAGVIFSNPGMDKTSDILKKLGIQ